MMVKNSSIERRHYIQNIGLGVGLGVTLGAALGNIALGIATGILLGGVGGWFVYRRGQEETNTNQGD